MKLKPLKYICRIDSDDGAVSWWVRIHQGPNSYIQKSFRSTRYGGVRKARQAAIQWRDEQLQAHGMEMVKPWARGVSTRKTVSVLGVRGISILDQTSKKCITPIYCIRVTYVTAKTREKGKNFECKSFRIYPEDAAQCWEAFKEAYKFKEEILKKYYRNGSNDIDPMPTKRKVMKLIRDYLKHRDECSRTARRPIPRCATH
jgi:hypothetical protein